MGLGLLFVYAVPSASMHPTLLEGDVVIVRKWGFSQPALYGQALPGAAQVATAQLQPGKVYVFYPPDMNVLYVKRLLALPGDVIALTEQGLVVNGETLPRELVSETQLASIYAEAAGDSRYQVQQLKQAASMPIRTFKVPAGHYFFLGDNRDNSDDSRHWGSVPAERIVGEVVAVVPR